MKKAFTIVEIMIVVSIIGILAALAVPLVGDYVTSAKESAAKADLRSFRNFIEVYAAQHNGAPPGYLDNKAETTPDMGQLLWQIRTTRLLTDFPKNPFNGKKLIKVIVNDEDMPAGADGTNGWIYKPSTRQFHLDWPGKDSKGVRYYDY